MIRSFENYTSPEKQMLANHSPAFKRYDELLSRSHSSDFFEQLRTARIKSWSEAALATYHFTHSAKEVCFAWSQAADLMIQMAYQHLELERFGLSVCALGKLGAQELNLSSDIDLILVTKDNPPESLQKQIRAFLKLLSGQSEWGPGFRVDLDLRPGGLESPMVTSLPHFQNYYWTQANLWERMALVRLRPIVGPQDLNDEIQLIANQYCYRKYLDYSLLEELGKLRPKIHGTAHRNANDSLVDLKLTPGFIRDIELFINAHQIIYGGRESRLRTNSTALAAEGLKNFEKVPDLFEKLLDIYWEYRQWENQVQAIDDFQIHEVDYNELPEGWKWPSRNDLEKRRQFVDFHISELLGSIHPSEADFPPIQNLNDVDLLKMGFSEESVLKIWPEVLKASALSRQKDLDDQKRNQVIRQFLNELSQSAFDKNLGLKGLKDFLSSIRAKATFFHLLAAEGKLVKDLSFLFCLSPYLGSLFSNRPELVDNFLFNRAEPFSLDFEQALDQMAERKQLAEIRSALSFLNTLKLAPLTEALTDTADAISLHLLELLEESLFKGSGVSILALGKWGGRELGFKSDLDFIFVLDRPPDEKHHKLVRRFMSHLRSPTAGGVIYNLDTRLRPQGKGGALIVEKSHLYQFLNRNAAGWERQAYLKGRWIHGRETFQEGLSMERGLLKKDLLELKGIREKLVLSAASDEVSLKYSKGGLLDIELALQTLVLSERCKISCGSTQGFFEVLKLTGHILHKHYFELRQMEQVARILSMEIDPKISPTKNFLQSAAKILTTDPEALYQKIRDQMTLAHSELLKIDPVYLSK